MLEELAEFVVAPLGGLIPIEWERVIMLNAHQNMTPILHHVNLVDDSRFVNDFALLTTDIKYYSNIQSYRDGSDSFKQPSSFMFRNGHEPSGKAGGGMGGGK